MNNTLKHGLTPGSVLLIQPFWGGDVTKALHCRMESLSLGYLAASLRQNNIEVDVIDAQLLCLGEEETVRRALFRPYDIIGISISAQRTYATAVSLIRALRAAGSLAHIVAGGIFATFAHDRMLQEVEEINSVVRGDGDLIIVDLVTALRTQRPLSEVRGLTYRTCKNGFEGTISINPDASPILDLDTLPFSSRDDLQKIVHEVRAGERLVGMLAGRGCEAKCSFCSIPAFVREQNRRFRSPSNVVGEMEMLHNNWGVTHFRFYDDTLIGRGRIYKQWLEEFSDLISDRLSGLYFEAMGVRADGVPEELFRKLHGAGLRKVFVGLDAGSPERLRKFRKPQTISTSERTVQILQDLGIEANYGFIMFQPTSTIAEIRHNFEFLQRIEDYKPHNLQNRFNLFFGVSVDERITEEGLLSKTSSLSSRRHYKFADPAVKLMADLIELISVKFCDAHVLAANLELLIIELCVMQQDTELLAPDKRARLARITDRLKDRHRDFSRALKATWASEFENALVLAEQGTDFPVAADAVTASALEAAENLHPTLAEIVKPTKALEHFELPGLKHRLIAIAALCQRACSSAEHEIADASLTRAGSEWSTLSTKANVTGGTKQSPQHTGSVS